MRERERLLWSILIIFLLIIAGYEGYNAYRIGRQVRAYQDALKTETLGSEDPQLRETVEKLESELQDRLTYDFTVTRDPLDLTQVLHTRRLLASLGYSESLESSNKMRLSCTVIAQEPAVVIKFQGRSQVLREGDRINGYLIADIQPEHCLLTRGSERLTLATEKAPESLEALDKRKEGTITISEPDTLTPPDENF